MGIINYSDVTSQKLNGYTADGVNLHNGYVLHEAVGYAKITSTLQTNIPVMLPSGAKTAQEQILKPDTRLVIPNGAIVVRLGLKLPSTDPNNYGQLGTGVTLVGTTGELLKVAGDATYDTTDPKITAASNAYAIGAWATVQRANGAAAVATSSLINQTAAKSLSLVVSNAGSTAAGTGIRTSSGIGYAVVQACWLMVQNALDYEDLGYIPQAAGV